MAGITKIYEDETDKNVLHSQEITQAIRDNNDALYRGLPLVSLGAWYLNQSTTVYDLDANRSVSGPASEAILTVESFWVPEGVRSLAINLAANIGAAVSTNHYITVVLTNRSTGDVYTSIRYYYGDFVIRYGSTRAWVDFTIAVEGGANYKLEVVGTNEAAGGWLFYCYALLVRPDWGL